MISKVSHRDFGLSFSRFSEDVPVFSAYFWGIVLFAGMFSVPGCRLQVPTVCSFIICAWCGIRKPQKLASSRCECVLALAIGSTHDPLSASRQIFEGLQAIYESGCFHSESQLSNSPVFLGLCRLICVLEPSFPSPATFASGTHSKSTQLGTILGEILSTLLLSFSLASFSDV